MAATKANNANLYSGAQPGGALYGLAASNPVNTEVAYARPAPLFGTSSDPMIGQKIGGITVIGGGFALYNKTYRVSGDTACGDHNIGWRTRHNLGFDQMLAGASLLPVGGVSGDPLHPDNCLNSVSASTLPAVIE